ncbi:hypothetical protein [Pararhodospirillum oryzae]|uniref:Uncharacterized protein n=1 Tax=Pararhodospirillum oryzae TaxID=478448 RepID=A0A512H6Y8_9PROT|nr:hypothetical protein [Pararhodospirillum oryzae]GEO81212.1 hypothetical protein ROR02_13430 [Pararhodospirillum oryzae]
MITIEDCLALCDADPEEVHVVASHERLSMIIAVQKAHCVLQQNWGGPAVRQMIRDQAHQERRAGHPAMACLLDELHALAHIRHPGGIDRRLHAR